MTRSELRPASRYPALAWLFALCTFCGAASAQREVRVQGMPEDAPFAVRATVDPARLVIDIAFREGWHAYAADVGGGDPISLRMTEPTQSDRLGQLVLPESEDGQLAGTVRLVQRLRWPAKEFRLDAVLEITVCDELECLPPFDLRLVGSVSPLNVLLVCGQRDVHGERIRAFLDDRGFAGDLTTYGEVTKAACENADVVIADSKLFRQARQGGLAKFPETTTPIVAVGFLGTELVERQGLAMTSGYI